MQGHSMVIVSQAENIGRCRDLTERISNGDQGKVQAQLKNWEQTVVMRVDGQPWWSSALTPYKGTSSTLSPFVVLT